MVAAAGSFRGDTDGGSVRIPLNTHMSPRGWTGVTDGSYIQLESLLIVLKGTKTKVFVLFLLDIYLIILPRRD